MDPLETAKECVTAARDLENIEDPADWFKGLEKIGGLCREIGGNAGNLDGEELVEIARTLRPGLNVYDLQAGGEIALTLGVLIENGLDSKEVGPYLVDPFLTELKAYATFIDRVLDEIEPEDDDSEIDEEKGGFWVSDRFVAPADLRRYWSEDRRLNQSHQIEPWYLPMVAVLKRKRSFLLELRNNKELMDLCDRLCNDGTGFVRELLRMPVGETFLVLHPETRQGYLVKLEGVTQNFQLHTLLGDALIRSFGKGPRDGIKGKRPSQAHINHMKNCGIGGSDHGEGIWDMYTWRSLSNGFLDGDVPTDFWIWGEGIPDDIETFEGQRIIVLGPPSYPRSWSAGPSFSDLPAAVLIEKVLNKSEVDAWIENLTTKPSG